MKEEKSIISPKLLITKALVWRFFIAIPVYVGITQYYVRDWETSIQASIVGNIVGTILYLLYDWFWLRILRKDYD